MNFLNDFHDIVSSSVFFDSGVDALFEEGFDVIENEKNSAELNLFGESAFRDSLDELVPEIEVFVSHPDKLLHNESNRYQIMGVEFTQIQFDYPELEFGH